MVQVNEDVLAFSKGIVDSKSREILGCQGYDRSQGIKKIFILMFYPFVSVLSAL